MHKGKIVLFIMAVSCGLIGCEQDSGPDISSVSIGKDGTIAHQIVGGFEQNYYEMEGLETLAADRVAEYCAENGQGSVTLESVAEEDDKILISINYATDRDYSSFNNRELFVGTMAEANAMGYTLEAVPFVTTGGDATEIGFMEDSDNKQIVIIGTKPAEELVVNTYGKVLYINRSMIDGMDVSFYGKKGVHITYPAREDSDESVLTYIVFE